MRRLAMVLVLCGGLAGAAAALASPKFQLRNGIWSVKFAGDDIGGGDFIVKQHHIVTFIEFGMNVPCSDGTFDPANIKRGSNLKERANGTFGPLREGNPGGVFQLFFGGEFTSSRKARGQARWSYARPHTKPPSTCDTGALRWTARWSSGS
jgi:hypothetical protein